MVGNRVKCLEGTSPNMNKHSPTWHHDSNHSSPLSCRRSPAYLKFTLRSNEHLSHQLSLAVPPQI